MALQTADQMAEMKVEMMDVKMVAPKVALKENMMVAY
jgi:hypothetical protein